MREMRTQPDTTRSRAKAEPENSAAIVDIAGSLGAPTPATAFRENNPNLALQRTLGNQGMQRALQTRAIQTKLRISEPDDPYEQEADRISERVMRMLAPGAEESGTTCAACASGGSTCAKCAARSARQLQRKAQSETAVAPSGAHVPDEILGGLGSGRPLDAETRRFFESRFNRDLGHVRVHADARASESARAVNALAFTVGRDVVFDAAAYAPQTSAGRRLMAHELTHVVQQGGTSRDKGFVPVSPVTKTRGLLQRWEGLEHKKVGNRAQNEFPYRGTILTDMTALRATPRKNPSAPHSNIRADIFSGAKVLVLGKERGWVQVLVESGTAQDNKGRTVSAETMTGYVSQELITKSGAIFDAELPVGGGLNLSYGDLVAFGGDHFKDFAQIADETSTPAGRARLKKLRDTTDSEATQSPAYEDSATISKEYAERYKNLALENVSHFSLGGTALTTWQEMHRDAIIDALEAGKKGDSTGLAKAYALNGFADHFLTDSFSSGHVRVPRERMIIYYKKFARDVFQHIIDYVSDRLGTRIYELLRQDYLRVRQFGDEGDRRDAVARVRAQIVQAITNAGGPAKVQENFGLYVAGAISKILHDLEGTQGLNVVSKKHPDGWTAFGDASLEVPGNAKNLAYVTEAVRASKQDLLNAFKVGLDVLTRHGKTPPQAAIDAAMADITKKVGPPYAALEFVPSPAPDVKPLPSWEWGNLDKTMQSKLVAVIAKYLTTTAQAELLMQFPPRQEIEIRGPNVDARPRDAARDILNEFLADPVRFLEQAFGRAAAP